MRSFREFFNEAGRLPFAGGTQYSGHFDLPDLKNLHHPDERPEGGWNSFKQIAQAGTQSYQMQGSDTYIIRDTLEKFRALAENVMSAIKLRDSQQAIGHVPQFKHYQKNYEHAQYDATRNIIIGLTKNEIVGGDYPRLRNEEVDRGEQLGVIFADTNTPGYWSLSINVLRQRMEELGERLHNQERAYRLIHTGAGVADLGFDAMLKPSANMPDFTKAS